MTTWSEAFREVEELLGGASDDEIEWYLQTARDEYLEGDPVKAHMYLREAELMLEEGQ